MKKIILFFSLFLIFPSLVYGSVFSHKKKTVVPTTGKICELQFNEQTGQILIDAHSNSFQLGATSGTATDDPSRWKEGINSNQGTVSITTTAGSATFTDDGQDFTSYIAETGSNPYVVIVQDEGGDIARGYVGALNGGVTSITIYSTRTGATQSYASIDADFTTGDTLTYEIIYADVEAYASLKFGGIDDYCTQYPITTNQGMTNASTYSGDSFLLDLSQDFSPYVGETGILKKYKVVIQNGESYISFGYLGEQGITETLGSDLFDPGAGTFDSGTYSWIPYQGLISNDNGELLVTYDSGEVGAFLLLQDTSDLIQNLTNRKLYRIDIDGRVPTGGSVNVDIFTTAIGNSSTFNNTSATTKTIYGCQDPTLILLVEAMNTGEQIWLDNITIKEVETPSNYGIKIYSTLTGSSQNWSEILDPNIDLTYGIYTSDFQGSIFTIASWVKGVAQSSKGIICKYNELFDIGWAIKTGTSSSSKFAVQLSEDGQNLKKDYESATAVLDSTWHHIACTYNGNNILTMYVDGNLEIPTKVLDISLTDLYESKTNVILGAWFSDYDPYGFFDGQISKTCIYNRVLSAGEILKLYTLQRQELIHQGFAIN